MEWTGRRAEIARPILVSGISMSSFLTLDSVALATPSGRPLFSNLSLNVGRECVGVVGRNGAGKSTLLRAILGQITPQSGTINRNGSVGMLEQAVAPGDETAADALGVSAALARIGRVEAGAGTEEDFAEANWALPQLIEGALASAGLPPTGPRPPAGELQRRRTDPDCHSAPADRSPGPAAARRANQQP
jgi:ATPase subunit of ABC transporter with duplicated ATPase domains